MACAECGNRPATEGDGKDGGGRCPACDGSAPKTGEPATSGAPDGQPWWVMSAQEVRAGERRLQREAPSYLRFEPTRALATVTTVLLRVCMVADLFAIVAGLRLILFFPEGADPLWHDMAGLRDAEQLYAVADIVQIAVLIAAGVPFLMWFHRSRLNAGAFDAGSMRMGPGWAIGAWFVPVVNFWFPKKIANDIWDASSPPGPDGTVRHRASRGLLTAWWALWLVTAFVGGSAFGGYTDAETVEEIRNSIVFHLFADGIDIVAALLAVAVVHRLTGMQHALQAHRLALAAQER